MEVKKCLLEIFQFCLVLLAWSKVIGQERVPPCAVLFSEENLSGEMLAMSDGIETSHLDEENGTAGQGWNVTKSLKVESGCILNVCNDTHFNGKCDIVREGTYRRVTYANGSKIRSGKCECRKAITNNPPLVNIPTNFEDLVKLAKEKGFVNHSGVSVAYRSRRKKRSSKSVYIVNIERGVTSRRSSMMNFILGNNTLGNVRNKRSSGNEQLIQEFVIPTPLKELGLANTDLRIIESPSFGSGEGPGEAAGNLAALDEYLSSHQDLSGLFPNAVLVFASFNEVGNYFDEKEEASLIETIHGLNSIRHRLSDEKHPNVVFVLSHNSCLSSAVDGSSEEYNAQFSHLRTVIKEHCLFLSPSIITVADDERLDCDTVTPNLVGNPVKKVLIELEQVTENNDDLIGLGVIRSASAAAHTGKSSSILNVSVSTTLIEAERSKINFFRHIISHASISYCETEVSLMLQHAWDNELSLSLKRKFPNVLEYTQRALNIRNIYTKGDLPGTNGEVVELLTNLEQNEAVSTLLMRGLNITGPYFPKTIVGHGYSVLEDKDLVPSPFMYEGLHTSAIGFKIPDFISCHLKSESSMSFYITESKDKYVERRFGRRIIGNISAERFNGVIKPGFNIRDRAPNGNNCSLSATKEVRLFEFILSDDAVIAPEYKEIITNLPKFNETDDLAIKAWTGFFNIYGTHFVRSAYGGGEIQAVLESATPCNKNITDALQELMKSESVEDMAFVELPVGVSSTFTFIGGNPAYHTSDIFKMNVGEAFDLLINWKDSLKYYPVILKSSVKLDPISIVAERNDPDFSQEILKAIAFIYSNQNDSDDEDCYVDRAERAAVDLRIDQLELRLQFCQWKLLQRD